MLPKLAAIVRSRLEAHDNFTMYVDVSAPKVMQLQLVVTPETILNFRCQFRQLFLLLNLLQKDQNSQNPMLPMIVAFFIYTGERKRNLLDPNWIDID